MSKKLISLTSEQEALMHSVRQEWLDLALSGKTEIGPDLRTLIDWLYRLAKLEPPSMVLVLDSPYGCQLAANHLKRLQGASDQVGAQVWDQVWDQVGAQVRDQVRDQVWAQVRDQVGAQVRDQVWDQVWDQVRDQVRDQVWAQVRDQVGAQVRAQVRDQVRDQVWAQVRDQVWAQVRDQVGAQVGAQKSEYFQFAATGIGWDSYWVAFYDFFARVGIVNHEGFSAYLRLMRCGLWDTILLRNVAIVCRRPAKVYRDEQNRLHRTDGPAAEWLDGYGSYFLHGMGVQQDWVEQPEKIDVQRVLGEQNIELRRALVTLMGYSRFVAECKAQVLDKDIDGGGQPRRLLKIAQRDDEDIYLIEVTDPSTGRQYHLRVPPTMKSCREAVAWGYGLPADRYAPLVEA